jgi:hypothetical protein
MTSKQDEERLGGTFFSHTHADDEAGGRFQKVNAATVIGSTPLPKYPELPSGPWSGSDPVGQEPPLGYSVDAMPPLEYALAESPSAGASQDGPAAAVPPIGGTVAGPPSPQKGASDAEP